MIDLAHEEALLFLARLAFFLEPLAFSNVRNGADDPGDPALTPDAIGVSKPLGLYPADPAVFPPDPVLHRQGPRMSRIKRRLESRPNPFGVFRMRSLLHQLV